MTLLARDLTTPMSRSAGPRRAQLLAELDAFFFRLYRIADPGDVDYFFETFQTDRVGRSTTRSKSMAITGRQILAEYGRWLPTLTAFRPTRSWILFLATATGIRCDERRIADAVALRSVHGFRNRHAAPAAR